VAATGSLGLGGYVLFLLQFFWQFPHFWAIAYVAYDDYANAGIRMLPSREKDTKFTAIQCMFYSVVLIPLAIVPRLISVTGNLGMWLCLLSGIMYFAAAVMFFVQNDKKSARRLMFASFLYLPVILIALIIDKV
jgi:protoheme IX farnesyltransferase